MRPSRVEVKNPKIYGLVKKELAKAWRIPGKLTHFPGKQPRPLNRDDLLFLDNYVVTEKSDGVRFTLLLSRLDNRNAAILVNRKFSMYQLQVFAPEVYFKGTVLEGELVEEGEGVLKFLVFDVSSFCGRSVVKWDFLKRYEKINDMCASSTDWNKNHVLYKSSNIMGNLQTLAENDKVVCIPEKSCELFIYPKSFYIFKGFMGSLVRNSRSLGHLSDGFIFTPLKAGANAMHLKWKYQPTIDLEYRKKTLYCRREGKIQHLTQFFIEEELVLDDSFYSIWRSDVVLEVVVKLKAEPNVFLLSILRTRSDKVFANDVKTIQSIFEEVRQNIQLTELVELSEKS